MNPQSLAAFLTPVSITPAAVEALYSVGHGMLSHDRAASAAPVFRVMLRCVPADERAWLGLGQCHEQLDQDGIALEIYGAGAVASHPAPRCHIARARLLRRLGRDDDAGDALDRARSLADAADDELHALIDREGERP